LERLEGLMNEDATVGQDRGQQSGEGEGKTGDERRATEGASKIEWKVGEISVSPCSRQRDPSALEHIHSV
jgi:hypothetical protein